MIKQQRNSRTILHKSFFFENREFSMSLFAIPLRSVVSRPTLNTRKIVLRGINNFVLIWFVLKFVGHITLAPFMVTLLLKCQYIMSYSKDFPCLRLHDFWNPCRAISPLVLTKRERTTRRCSVEQGWFRKYQKNRYPSAEIKS